MIKAILILASLVFFGYICVAGLLYAFQRDFLYFPTEKYEHPFERFGVSSEDETIEVIVLNRGNSKALMYFGGNGEAVISNAQDFSSIFSDTTIYLINYRGYGGSSGEPTESGIYTDALTVYDEIEELHAHISVAGRSLGSGVAMYLAANRAIERVALITPYDSVLNVAKTKFSMFPVKLLLKDHFDSLSKVRHIKSKVLVIAAEHDRVIPMSHTQRLINEFKSDQVLLKVIKKVGHNNLSDSAEYYKALSDFI